MGSSATISAHSPAQLACHLGRAQNAFRPSVAVRVIAPDTRTRTGSPAGTSIPVGESGSLVICSPPAVIVYAPPIPATLVPCATAPLAEGEAEGDTGACVAWVSEGVTGASMDASPQPLSDTIVDSATRAYTR